MMDPLHQEFGWSHASISVAAAVNMVLYGAISPFAASCMERYGMRAVVVCALGLVAAGAALPTFAESVWQLTLYWGVLVGLGTGSIALAFVATLTSRWFVRHRGLITGILTAGSTAGQLIFLPVLAWLVGSSGWRTASLTVAASAVVVIPVVLLLVKEHPRDVGQQPVGARTATAEQSEDKHDQRSEPNPLGVTTPFQVLRKLGHDRTSWYLAAGFAICGATTTGLVQTHFIPAASDHMMPQTTAASLLAIAGLFDLVGTVASGWLTDRVDPRYLLLAYYGLRGVSLLLLPSLFTSAATPTMLTFAIFYGLDWVATVPPVMALCQQWYGSASGVVFGWLWTAHQVGAGIVAIGAGFVRDQLGDYSSAWYISGALCFLAATLSILISKRSSGSTATASDPHPELIRN